MPEEFKIPQFKDREDFQNWWQNPDTEQYFQKYPDQLSGLFVNDLVKPYVGIILGMSDQDAKPAQQPKQFGKYQLVKKLGQGGMGLVYLAVDQNLNRQVALKVITSNDKEMLDRFQREAKAVAMLKHPNIVQIYEAGHVDKQHYFTMDYIEGVSLDDISQSKTPELFPRLARIIFQVAQALYYAHSQGIIHRDIKPANILVDKSGKAYITDFGLAKQLTGEGRALTMSGTVVGTPEYMSPEQAQGKKDQMDQLSDIFSLGSTLYYCMTGRPPHQSQELFEVLSKVINEEPTMPSRIVQSVPKELETICLKCMEKDRAKRYQNAAELAGDLKRYLEGAPIVAKRTSSASRLWRRMRQNKTASIGVTSAAVITLAAVGWWLYGSAQTGRKVVEYNQQAHRLFEEHKYEESLSMCEKVLGLSPADFEAYDLKDKCLAQIKTRQAESKMTKAQLEQRSKAKVYYDRMIGTTDLESRIKLADEAIRIDPTFGDVYQLVGYAYKEKGDNDKAYEYFNKAIIATPGLAYAHYERGWITNYIYGKPNESIDDFTKVIEYDPNSHLGWLAKGNIESGQNKHEQALASYNKAIELKPDYDLAYYQRGWTYFYLGDLKQLIKDHSQAFKLNKKLAVTYPPQLPLLKSAEYYTELIRLNPDVPILHSHLGFAYSVQNKADQAIAAFNEGVKRNAMDYVAWAMLADNYMEKAMQILYTEPAKRSPKQESSCREYIDNAISACTEAIKLNPEAVKAYIHRANALGVKANNLADSPDQVRILRIQALDDLNKALALEPRNKKAHEYRGQLCMEMGQYEQAIDDFTAGIRLGLGQEVIDAYNRRGIARLKAKDYAGAKRDFDEAIRLMPNMDAAYMNRSILFLEQGKMDEAIADISSAIVANPKNPAYFFRRAGFYKDKHMIDKAIADFTEALKLAPGNIAYLNQRGVAYGENNMFEPAIADFTEAIRIEPYDAGYYANRAHTYVLKGDGEKAWADIVQALKFDPKLVSAYYVRAMIHHNRADYKSAVADYTRVLELDEKSYASRVYEGRASSHFYLKDYDKAIADYTKAYENGASASVLLTRADAYAQKAYREKSLPARKEILKKAIADVEEFIRLSPKEDRALIFLKRDMERWKQQVK
ncbi:MAG: tetratricopeptide repeat protein [Candidatus Brocadiia bacterium]